MAHWPSSASWITTLCHSSCQQQRPWRRRRWSNWCEHRPWYCKIWLKLCSSKCRHCVCKLQLRVTAGLHGLIQHTHHNCDWIQLEILRTRGGEPKATEFSLWSCLVGCGLSVTSARYGTLVCARSCTWGAATNEITVGSSVGAAAMNFG